MSKFITINKRKIGSSYPPYIIAEMSANHNGDINNAYKIIDMAKAAGADAIKMQTYTADTLTIDSDLPEFQLIDGLWANRSLYDLYKEASTPWSWHKPLFEYAKKIGLTIFSSPFDNSSVDLLESLNSPAYKIASFEAVDLSLIEYIAKTGKPMIISTGMANEEEIQEAIDSARGAGCMNIAILHCVSGYPAPSEDYNLNTMIDMKKRFNLVTGLSDHTIDNSTAIAGIALGASIVEKHVTLNRNGGGPDDSFSLEPEELENLCKGSKNAWKAIGKVDYGRKTSELGNVKFRRSLYIVKDIEAGEVLSNDHVKSIRPGYGLAPKYLNSVIGKKVKKNLHRGEALKLEYLEKQ